MKNKNTSEDLPEPETPSNPNSIEDNLVGFGGFGKAEFSKPALVMTALLNCVASANCEMRPGYTLKKIDVNGNVNETYIEDGRKKHISCIEFLGEILSPEFDNEAEKNIEELLDSVEKKKKEFADYEIETWQTMPNEIKRRYAAEGIYPISGYITLEINKELMTEFQLKIYKNIFVELNHLLKRLKYFKKKEKVG